MLHILRKNHIATTRHISKLGFLAFRGFPFIPIELGFAYLFIDSSDIPRPVIWNHGPCLVPNHIIQSRCPSPNLCFLVYVHPGKLYKTIIVTSDISTIIYHDSYLVCFSFWATTLQDMSIRFREDFCTIPGSVPMAG